MTYTQILRGVCQAVLSSIFGKVWYVDSTNGVDTNSGRWAGKPFKTLTKAIASASAGDRISLVPGGSETITAALAITQANLKVICDVESPDEGFLIQSAADIELMTISAAGVLIRGLRFKHTSTTTNRNGIKVLGGDGATAGQLGQKAVIQKCVFNEGGVDGRTDRGITLIGNTERTRIEDCDFHGCQYGIYIADHASDTTANFGTRIKRCRFTVGKTNYWGIYSDGSNQVNCPLIEECEFFEALGTGAAATNAWNGTSGTDGTVGPIKLAATADRGMIRACRGYTASAYSFVNLCNMVAGATMLLRDNLSATAAADLDTLAALHAVPTADVTTNANCRDVVGNKTDAAVTASTTTKTLMAYLKGVLNLLIVPTADATANATITDVTGNKTDAVVQAETTNKSLMGYIKGLVAAICGTAGVATWPAAAAPANGVSLAAALRKMYEAQGWRMVSKASGDLTGQTAVNLFTVTGLCEVRVFGVIGTAIARAAGVVTHEVGTSGNTAGILAQAADCRQAGGTLLLSGAAAGKTCGADVDTRIVNAATILLTLSAGPDSGDATYYCMYRPISATGAVAAA